MEDIDTEQSFEDILRSLQHPAPSKRRDPRSIRLAAVTSALLDVVGEDPTASKVYAKAVAALEGTLSSHQDAVDSLATQSAVLELLHVTIPLVTPAAILSATLPLASRVLRAVVSTASASTLSQETNDELGGVNALLRWTCRVATVILQRLPLASDEKTVKNFLSGTLLMLFSDRRPKVRKAAHNGAVEVLMEGKRHPAVVTLTNTYLHNELVKASGKKQESLQDLLHLLPFVERSILHLNFVKLGSDIMEFIAALLQNSTASATDFIAVPKIMGSTPKIITIGSMMWIVLVMLQDDDEKRSSSLNEFAPRVLASLLQAKPSLVFYTGAAEFEILSKTKTIYGQLVLAACSRIIDYNKELACKLLPLAVQTVLVLSRPSDEDLEDTTVAQTLLVELTQLFRTKLPSILNSSSNCDKCLQDLMQSTTQVMDPTFRPTWSVSLKSLVVLLQHVHASVDVQKCVESLLELINDVPPGSASRRAVEDAVSALIQGVGIEKCWTWIHWQPPSSKCKGISTERAWILSVMKAAATAAQAAPPRLAFFQSDVMELARSCDKLAATSSATEQNIHRSRVVDLWSLFPCFCKSPLDIETAMPTLTASLSRALDDKRYPELLTFICNGLTTLVKSIDENGGFELDHESGDVTALGASSVVLLPVMFKYVSDAHVAMSPENKSKTGVSMYLDESIVKMSDHPVDSFQKLQCVTEAISSLARLAPDVFLRGLFKKLMHRLLEEVQSETGESEKICSLLALSQALVASEVLDESSISFLYRALKPLIRNDEDGPRVQKRAYKILAEVCERHHAFVAEPERLQELSVLLTGTIMTSQISARYMRLKCLNIIVDGFDESNTKQLKEIYKVIAEVLLCLKDSNGKTREAANQLLLALSCRGDIVEFINVIVAALGAESSHMRSAVVMALSRIVFEKGWDNEQLHSLLPDLLRTVLVLIDEGSREVTKSVIGFTRICVAAIPPEQLEPLLPELIGSLLRSQQAKSRFRAKIKIILKKLVKLYGYEALMTHVPEAETRLLTHMRKLSEREKRKKQARRESGKSDVDQFDAMVDSDEDDSDDGRTFVTGATGISRRSGREKASAARSIASQRTKLTTSSSIASAKTKFSGNATFRLPDETDGEIVDMLGQKMAKRVHFAYADIADSDSDGGAVEFDDDGKLVVRDDEVDEEKKGLGTDEVLALNNGNKRRRLTKLEHGGTKKMKGASTGGLGASYKSKKAGGDVMRKGQKYDPYAYVPLDGRAYSKKNRRSAVEQMSSVVRKAGKRKR